MAAAITRHSKDSKVAGLRDTDEVRILAARPKMEVWRRGRPPKLTFLGP